MGKDDIGSQIRESSVVSPKKKKKRDGNNGDKAVFHNPTAELEDSGDSSQSPSRKDIRQSLRDTGRSLSQDSSASDDMVESLDVTPENADVAAGARDPQFEVSTFGVSDGLPGSLDDDDKALKAKREEAKFAFAHRLHKVMLLEGLILGTLTCTYSTELLGVFFAGFNFSTQNDVRKVFHTESLPVMKWLGMAFFASLGFSIPVDAMMSWKMFGSGLVMTIPAVFGKVLTGMCFMRGRGEYEGVSTQATPVIPGVN